MEFNQFNFYSMAAANETKAKAEYDEALKTIEQIKKCGTIREIKTFLKQQLGITSCVDNFKIGKLGSLSLKDEEERFVVNIKYADETNVCIYPKKPKVKAEVK